MSVRDRFPILATRVHGHALAYLDSAASAQKPKEVLDAMDAFMRASYANVHRGIHALAERATQEYEDARATMARFLNAQPEEIVFTSGTTAAINLAAQALVPTFDGGEIAVTMMEHHSDLVPWQQLAQRHGLTLKHIPITPDYALDMDAARAIISAKTRLVAVTHVSNVLGTINPIKELAALAHAHGALILVDGAQAVPHMRVDVQALDVDLYACSGHKMYGPTGIGVLYGKRALLERMEPPAWGGEMVKEVTVQGATWNDIPWKLEPGTPNIVGAVGMAAAAAFIEGIGHDAIATHEHALVAHALEGLARVPGVTIIGRRDAEERGTAIAFTLEGVHPHDVAAALDEQGIAVRAGHHCCQPLHCALGIDATTRLSIAIYTTREEIDRFVEALSKVREVYG